MHEHTQRSATAAGQPAHGFNLFAVGPAAGLQPAPESSPTSRRDPLDADFVFLQQAYRASGGLAHGDELAARLHVDGTGGYARLARWIVSRQVFSFSWHDHFWLPMFQFDPTALTLRPGLRPVLSELADVMDGWAVANWFAQPNDALEGRTPVAMWLNHWPDVFQAARLQRFVARG